MASASRRLRPPPARERVAIAVFPVAGLGTSFLPATKACPKEMLPIVDRPLIQYAVEEAAAAGITRILLVTGRAKRAIEDHFDRAYELERELAARESIDALRELHSAVPSGVTFSYVRQREPSGLPDALRMARRLIGDAPFAVILPDDLIDSPRAAIGQLREVFDTEQASIVGACESLAGDSAFIAADLGISPVAAARALVRVPPIGAASRPVTPCGRYVFTNAIWNALDRGHDPMLVRTIRALMERDRVFACLIEGRHFDCGTKLGFLEAQFAFAQKRRELWPELRTSLGPLFDDNGPPRERTSAGPQDRSEMAAIASGHVDGP